MAFSTGKYVCSFLILISVFLKSVAQDNLVFEVDPIESSEGLPAGYTIAKFVPDSLSGLKATKELINQLHEDGYLLASADSMSVEADIFHSQIYVGERYQWGKINFLDEGKTRSELKNRKWIENTGAQFVFSKAIQHSNNNGFPFASVRMDSVVISNGIVSGLAILDPGPLVAFDTLLIEPENKSRTKYLSKFLRILPGKPYNEKAVQQIPDNLNLTPYYQLASSVQMVFHNNNARINFDVEKISTNRLDGIIGLLPNSSGDGKALITGELNLELMNMFESGKEFTLHWQRIREETQMIDLALKVPGILNSFDLLAKYYQLKEDTTFVN